MGDARVKYSVIIPTYNREPLLAEALRSVQAALPDCSEVIVVNDGPAFETPTRDLIKTLGAVAVKTKGGLGAGAARLFSLQISPMGFAAPASSLIAQRCSASRQPRPCFIFSRKRAPL